MIATLAGCVRYGRRVPLRTCRSWCFAANARAWLIRSEYPVVMASVATCICVRDASTATVIPEPSQNVLEPRGVVLVEARQMIRIDVQHGDEFVAVVQHRQHNLRPRPCIAGDVTRKPIDV